jgi:CTP-dependent riboflavin kinase
MANRLVGRVQSGNGDASRWLSRFNAAYSAKAGMPVFPGSLNLALPAAFDWFAPNIQRRTVWFDRTEYGGARDILLVPCRLLNLDAEPGWLWTPTTAARDRLDPWVIEIIAAVNLRQTYGLSDGAKVEVELLERSGTWPHQDSSREPL